MADISKITTLDGITYDVKDKPSREMSLASIFFGKDGIPVLEEKTYTDVIGTANDNNGGGFFYLKVRPDYFTCNTTTVDSRELWHVKTRVIATVPNQAYYYTDTVFDIWGRENTYCLYSCSNQIYSTSYRPIYYNSVFFTNSTGYANNCGHWIGFNLYNSTNPTSTSYKRTVTVQLLAYDNCEVELQNSLITPTNIPNRSAHTDWYTSTNTSYTNFDASNNGLKQTGDNNTTSISNLVRNGGTYVTNSALYRYQLLFQMDENTLTPLNNNNNTTGTTKTMLTDVEFDPFGYIYYYGTTTNVTAAGSISASYLFYAYYGIDLRYTFNCGTTLTAHKPFYLVVTSTTGGKCKIASSTPWTQTLPATNDGKWYILLGRTYSTYQLTLYPDHPIYYHDGTSVKQIIKSDIIGNLTGNVTGNVSGTAANVTGTVAVANGGTGETTAKNAANVLINGLDTGSTTPIDADYFISQRVGGGTTTTTYNRRPMSALWEYIKGKISSVLGLTVTTYGGSAAKVNNHTVDKDVPSNAVFTDTTYNVIVVVLPNASTSNRTFNVTGINANHKLIQNGYVCFSNPSAVGSDLVLTTANGTITIEGTLTGTTDITATFAEFESTVTGTAY